MFVFSRAPLKDDWKVEKLPDGRHEMISCDGESFRPINYLSSFLAGIVRVLVAFVNDPLDLFCVY